MKVSIVTEVRIYSFDKKFYVDSSFLKIIERYKKAFGDICLFSRVVESDNCGIKGLKIIEQDVNIYNIGSITSFLFSKIKPSYYDIFKKSELIILRVPSLVSLKLYNVIRKERKKYMCEIMGCAFDAYWNHGIIGKLIALPMFLMTRKIIKKANYCLYVTKRFLQNRYPTNAYSINASNVNIDKPITKKDYSNVDKTTLSLFTAAALNVKYKGQKYVIECIKNIKKQGINVNYYLAGKGDSRYLEEIAKKNGVLENVHVLGMLNKEELNKIMLQSDIYIQPSLQEGLPRSLIEAMNCGLVCMGAKTAGIPELLDSCFVFERKSSKSIEKCILNNIDKDFSEVGENNINEASKYYSSVLDKRREEFYNYIIKDVSKCEGKKV